MTTKEKNNFNLNNGLSENTNKFATLNLLIKVAESKGREKLAKILESIRDDSSRTSSLVRLHEKIEFDPDIKKMAEENDNAIFVGGTDPIWRDRTFNTKLSDLAENPKIKAYEDEFYKLVSETMDFLFSKEGEKSLSLLLVLEDMAFESSSSKNTKMLDSMANGIVERIKEMRSPSGEISPEHYTKAKLIVENLLLNSSTSKEMKNKLRNAWEVQMKHLTLS